ncbi:unnamed protein product [Protopolystoma xenopodis]|uniref:Uncharacterized protein n=1 Tax=Protopolystoma xenopodis TaxID=117903 RepID=A0A448XH85_9PLAT|nr:unnamed protein product [Protopolystoma xenopodis]
MTQSPVAGHECSRRDDSRAHLHTVVCRDLLKVPFTHSRLLRRVDTQTGGYHRLVADGPRDHLLYATPGGTSRPVNRSNIPPHMIFLTLPVPPADHLF